MEESSLNNSALKELTKKSSNYVSWHKLYEQICNVLSELILTLLAKYRRTPFSLLYSNLFNIYRAAKHVSFSLSMFDSYSHRLCWEVPKADPERKLIQGTLDHDYDIVNLIHCTKQVTGPCNQHQLVSRNVNPTFMSNKDCGKAINYYVTWYTMWKVLDMTRPGIEPVTPCTRGGRSNNTPPMIYRVN